MAAENRVGHGGAGKSPLLFIFLTVFIDLLGFGIVIPLLPVYSKLYGASARELGLLFATFSAMQFVFAPMWGRLSDRIGRKPVLVGGLIGSALAYALFANAHSLVLLFASRALAGFFGANISTAQAYIADVTTPVNRAKGMGLIGAAFGLGFTLGPFFGGELSQISLEAPGWFASGLSLTAALFGWRMLREPPKAARTHSRVFGFDQVREAARDSRIGTLLVLSFLFIVSFSGFESFFVWFGITKFPDIFHLPAGIEKPTLEQTLQAAPVAGQYLAIIGIISAVIQGVLIRRLVKRFGETALAVVGPLVLAIGFVVVGLATTWPLVIVGCLIMPLGFGINNPSLSSLISRATPESEQGAFMGLNQSALSLARVAGPLLASLVFALGPSAPFFTGAGILALSASIALWYHGRHGSTFPRTAAPAVAVEA
jgi:DHA1 family tetracycline resistance protein-like MFS transporter